MNSIPIIVFTSLFHCFFAQLCSDIKVTTKLVNAAIFVANQSSDGVFYISSGTPGERFQGTTNEIVSLLPLTENICPESCKYELLTYSSPRNDSILHVRGKPFPLITPFGYQKQNDRISLSCARQKGDCGATIPILRHYKFTPGGIVHAYSFNKSSVPNFIPELMPICYGWPSLTNSTTNGTIPGGSTTGSDTRPKRSEQTVKNCSSSVPSHELKNLTYYYNNAKQGNGSDHYLTTHSVNVSDGYEQLAVFGQVLQSSTVCSCSVKLIQLYDKQDGAFVKRDHKMVMEGERNRTFEQYIPTGEVVYCAKKKGDCGANIPLYKHFDYYAADTKYSTDEGGILNTESSSSDPLCFIWSIDNSFSSSSTTSKSISTLPPNRGNVVWYGFTPMWLFPNGSLVSVNIG